MHCPNCGETVTNTDLFCGECGAKLTLQDQSSTDNPTTNQHTSQSDVSQNQESSQTSYQPKQQGNQTKIILNILLIFLMRPNYFSPTHFLGQMMKL